MSKKKTNEIDRRMFKKEGEELQQYLHFRKRGSVVKNKKGKGSYKREKKNWGDES
jgi:stalled ribosome alternative rescue factor ArfA